MEDSLDKVKTKCVSAYTLVKCMGQYAADQLKEAMECKPSREKMKILSGVVMNFIADLQNSLNTYSNDIRQLSEDAKLLIPFTDTTSDPSSGSAQTMDVKNIKQEHSNPLSLKRTKTTEENTDDDFLEIYMVENIGEYANKTSTDNTEDNAHIFNTSTELQDSDSSGSTYYCVQNEEKQITSKLKALGDDDKSESSTDSLEDNSRSITPVSPETERLATTGCLFDNESKHVKSTDEFYLKKFNIKPCYVALDQVDDLCTEINPNTKVVNEEEKEMREIDRLTNLASLENPSRSIHRPNVRLKKRNINASASDTSDDSPSESDYEPDTSDESSSEAAESPAFESEHSLKSHSDYLPSNVEDTEQDVLSLLSGLGESCSSVEESISEDESVDGKNKDIVPENNKKSKNSKKRERSDSEDDYFKSKWRRDSLLTRKLSSTEPSDEEEDIPDVPNEDVPNQEEIVADNNEETNESYEYKKEIVKNEIQKNIPMETEENKMKNETVCLTSDLSDDSDCEFITNTPKSEDGHKGRRNIRSVISREDLAKDTKAALRDEEERVRRLNEQKKLVSQSQSQLEEGKGLVLDIDKESGKPLIIVDGTLTAKLKDHQREGVKFMWNNCYESVEMLQSSKGNGCILAHCMGLGKTFQAITLIHTLFKYPETKTKCVLIVCPFSIVSVWMNEFRVMLKGAEVLKGLTITALLDKKKMSEKFITLANWHRSGGVLIVGYEWLTAMVKKYERTSDDLTVIEQYKALINPGPDLIICDEGHLIRNESTRRSRTLHMVNTRRRIILTGTPFQNNLTELYQMVHFVKPNFLGTNKEFMNRFGNPIENGGYYDSTEADIKLMRRRSHILHKQLKDFVQRYEDAELKQYLPDKIEYVLLITMHSVQIELYKHYLNLACGSMLTSKKFLNDYVILRNVWSHPRMLQEKEKAKMKTKEAPNSNKEPDDVILVDRTDANISHDWYRFNTSLELNDLMFGPKLSVIMSIVDECETLGDKLIIFSAFLESLNTIEYFLKTHGTTRRKQWRANVDYLRLDGSVNIQKRAEYCQQFNSNPNIKVFLVSQKVGGVGLNLFAANRVILVDINFNPAVDRQSVARTYRFGQKKTCYIYRLVAMGTMEETVYERSVTKSAISARVVDEQQIQRHFKKADLEQMYRFRDLANEPRPIPRIPRDQVLAKILQKHKEVFKYHDYEALLVNQLDEQLDEDEQLAAWQEFKMEEAARLLNESAAVAGVQIDAAVQNSVNDSNVASSSTGNNPSENSHCRLASVENSPFYIRRLPNIIKRPINIQKAPINNPQPANANVILQKEKGNVQGNSNHTDNMVLVINDEFEARNDTMSGSGKNEQIYRQQQTSQQMPSTSKETVAIANKNNPLQLILKKVNIRPANINALRESNNVTSKPANELSHGAPSKVTQVRRVSSNTNSPPPLSVNEAIQKQIEQFFQSQSGGKPTSSSVQLNNSAQAKEDVIEID